jgi:hypothetical protein
MSTLLLKKAVLLQTLINALVRENSSIIADTDKCTGA